MSQQEEVKLEKGLSPLGVWGLALGAMIGWGCFVMQVLSAHPSG